MRLPKDILTGTMTRPRLFLCETDGTRIYELDPISMSGSFKFNAYSELTFTVGRTYTDMITGETQVNPFYNKLESLRLVELDGFGYYEIQEPEISSDGIREVKNITAYSLEYTLSQKYLEDFYINTGDTMSVEVIYAKQHGTSLQPVTLRNPTSGLSLLDLALEKIPDWTIGYVDPALYPETEGRTFEISRASIYDFITQDICEKFNCFTVFDTFEKRINLYAETSVTKHIGDDKTKTFRIYPAYWEIGTVSVDGYKTTQYTYEITKNINGANVGYLTFEKAPADGAKIEITDGSQDKWTTDVYVSFENLAQEVTISHSADDIKTVLTVKGSDDLDICEVNMGLPYIVDLSYYHSVDWMGQDLYDRYTEYLKANNAYRDTYASNAEKRLELGNKKDFEESRTSLCYGVDHSVNSQTVGTYYIISGGSYPDYYYKEVSLPKDYNANTVYYKLDLANVTEDKVYKLYDAIRKYFMDVHNEEPPEIKDIATNDGSYQELLEDLTEIKSFDFILEQFNILKSTLTPDASVDTVSTSFTNFLMLLWGDIGLFQLQNFLQKYELIETTSKEYADENSGHYWFYYPVTIVLKSLNAAITARQEVINELKEQINELDAANNKATLDMSVYNFFNEDQRKRLSSFLREDEYTDDNFVETDADTIERLMETKQELFECGKIELSKLCGPKLSFSMNMANIYALPEFEPIIHQFQLGNLINVELRKDYIKRARLLKVDINFDDFSDFTCEFGELTSLRTPSSIHADLLSSALSAGKSVSSNLSYWNKGADTSTNLSLLIQQGLLDANTTIKSIKGVQGVEISESGIRMRKYNESTGALDPEEGWIVNNQILYSSDNFKTTTESVFGKYTITVNNVEKEMWGVLAKAVMAGYIGGCEIEGGTIDIGEGTFVVDSAGNVTMNAASISGYVTNNKLDTTKTELSDELNTTKTELSNEINAVESELSSRITVTEKGIETKVSKDSIISTINQSAESVVIDASKISLAGKTINLTSDNITIKSTNFNVTKDGKITATSGEIAGWTIYDHLLRKEITKDDVTYQMYMQAADGTDTTNAFAVRKKEANTSDWDVQFAVNYAGKLTAKNANITGTITALDGSIAGYNIGSGGSYSNAIYKRVAGDGTGEDYEVGMKASDGDTDLAFYVKVSTDNWNSSSNVFYVNNSGKLYAKNADITGKITASSGAIGSWSIGDMGSYTDSIYSTYCAASTPSSSNPEYAVFMRGKGAETTIAFGVKSRTSSSTSWNDADNPFYVRKDGYVRMMNANVTGTINAESGEIGGCKINDGVLNISAANITSGTIASARIPNLNADKITAGTLDVGRIPNISASKITSGTISTDRLDASVITTGNFSSKTLSTSNLTVASGCRLGVASEYNALIRTVGDYTYIRGYGPDVNYETSFYNLVKYVVQNSSNQEIKSEIHDFDDRYDVFFDKLNPQLFKYNFEPNMGYTMGYIWQEAEQARIDAGLGRNDIGAITETDSVVGGLALSKQDFIALNTWQIQKLKTRVEELESRLATLEA